MTFLPHLRGTLFTLAFACAFTSLAQTPTDKQKAQAADAYLAGARMLDRRDYTAAEKHFAHALELAPSNRDYLTALAIAREHHVTNLVQQAGRERFAGHTASAETLLADARALDPQNTLITQHETAAALQAPPSWLIQPPVYAGAIAPYAHGNPAQLPPPH